MESGGETTGPANILELDVEKNGVVGMSLSVKLAGYGEALALERLFGRERHGRKMMKRRKRRRLDEIRSRRGFVWRSDWPSSCWSEPQVSRGSCVGGKEDDNSVSSKDIKEDSKTSHE